MKSSLRRLAVIVLAVLPATAAWAAPTAAERAAELVSKMTLEEKAAQLKDLAPAIPRLGVPAYGWWNEGLHGVARAGYATVFPQAIGLAATFDAPLIGEMAGVTANEFRAKYLETRKADGSTAQYRGLTVWSPNINIFRDPRWGRGQETFGEDPHLTGRIGVAFIEGLQGADLQRPITIATAKHFAVHSGPEADRHKDDIHPSAHDLEDTYLPAFRETITEAKVGAVMCAYNAIDGIPACASPLMESRIRQDWGFKGHVVSDCAAIADFVLPTSHRYVKTAEQGVAAALNAGTDLFCREFGFNKSSDPQIVVNAVKQGLVNEAVLDRAVTRLFEARFQLGLMDPPVSRPEWVNDTPAHRAKALEVARASLVLLKNDGLLPLKAAPKRIAVIGPNAENVDALIGNYSGTPSAPVTIVGGLKKRFPDAQVEYVEGTGPVGPPFAKIGEAALCADAACATRGLKREEFASTDLSGPATVTAAPQIEFAWGRPIFTERQSSMRWSGWLVPAETGRHRLKFVGDSGFRVLLGGKPVLDAWSVDDPATAPDTEIELVAGKAVPITVEAVQKGSRSEQGLRWSLPTQGGGAAVAVARKADLVVFAAGLTARLEGEEMRVNAKGFSGGDRTILDLPEPQQALLEQLHATGKPVVLVLMNGSAMAVNWADANIPAIVEAWYPGGEGGQAVAELIAGDFSPSGRLPVTFYKSAEQLPPFKDYDMKGRTYRYFSGEPLYPFGHGLSYTSFAYAKPVLSTAKLQAGQPLTATARVTNSGAREGAEVVQLYVSHEGKGPIRALQGFQRVTLKPGESRDLRFTLDARALSTVDGKGIRAVRPGKVTLWAGGGQPGHAPGESADFAIGGSAPIPR